MNQRSYWMVVYGVGEIADGLVVVNVLSTRWEGSDEGTWGEGVLSYAEEVSGVVLNGPEKVARVYYPLLSTDGGGALTFKGTVSEPATVTVQGKPAVVASDNRFEGRAQVTTGTNTVAVVATDASGNIRTNNYQLTVSSGPKTFSHDANGSLTANGTKTYEWDGQNRLVRVLEDAAEVVRFSYDGLDRRAQKIASGLTRTYVYDREDLAEERLSSGGTVRYVHGPGADRPLAAIDGAGSVTYYLANHLGSVVQATGVAAQLTLTRQYDATGSLLTGSASSGYAFTGREWDAEPGLYYYRARYYDPKMGRFISEDPIGFRGGDNNLYAYVWNRPTTFVDPSGLAGIGLFGSAQGEAGFIAGIAGQAGMGGAVFLDGLSPSIGSFLNGGWYSGYPGNGSGSPSNQGWVVGASGGAGVGVFGTNARDMCDLAGPMDNINFSAGVGVPFQINLQLSFGTAADGKPIWAFGISPPWAGGTLGGSFSIYQTNTTVWYTSKCGCPPPSR